MLCYNDISIYLVLLSISIYYKIVSAKKIRNGEVTSEQLVNLFVERIK